MDTLALIGLVVVGLFVYFGNVAAYKNGVRDGYQNNWLPHVQKQIQDEELTQRIDRQ